MNMPIQGSAADIIKIAMVKVFNRLKKENLASRIILQVHDELLLEVKKDEKEIVEKLLKEEMENAVKLLVPLVADVHSGETWFDAK
jgi:DNA polymerase-1